jgi:hypothetical protein
VHILIYQLPKGEHAFALAQNDSVGDANLIYSRSIKMRYLGLAGAKPDEEIESQQKRPGPFRVTVALLKS